MSEAIRHESAARWSRPAELVCLGRAPDTGLRQASFLVRRGDGQVIQLSPLLYQIIAELNTSRDPAALAEAISAAYGRRLTLDGLAYLMTTRLLPLGLAVDLAAPTRSTAARAPKADPLLALRLRITLLPEPVVGRLARLASPLFTPAVVVLALVGCCAVDALLWRRGGLFAALGRLWTTPVFLLALLGLLSAGALLHEIGHAAACAYGGGRPGAIGFGVYLLYPAFFTNVTDSYRLDRPGRLRTDLGGLYFNVWCLLALDGAYLATGHGLLLLAALLMHLEMLQQLVPTVRFDGYYLLADLAGVPDLFARVRPVLTSLIPGRPVSPRVSELRPRARWIVTGWVLVVIPLLMAGLGWFLYTAPYLLRRTTTAIARQLRLLATGWTHHDVALMLLAVLSVALLAIPLLGLALLGTQLLARALRLGRSRLARHPNGAPAMDHPTTTTSPYITEADQAEAPSGHESSAPPSPEVTPDPDAETGLTAAAFTDAPASHQPPAPTPARWRRGLAWASAGTINARPSAAQRLQATLKATATRPIEGSKRIVVISRKGGVGKTTLTLALGGSLAQLRGDRIAAVDANPDAGNLAHRAGRGTDRTITDVLADLSTIASYPRLRSYLSQASDSRLEVLASDDDPKISCALDRDAYRTVIDLLDRYYNLTVLDTGTGILDSANQGLLGEADQLVLVLRPGLDSARAAASTLDWLEEHRYTALVRQAVVAINGVSHRAPPQPLVVEHFGVRCSTVVTVPFDPLFETGSRTTLAGLHRHTHDALLQLSAAVVDNLTRNGERR